MTLYQYLPERAEGKGVKMLSSGRNLKLVRLRIKAVLTIVLGV